MSIKVKLEKDGRVVNGFTGFSWTLVFFGFWVPAFRERGKDFCLFFIFFIMKVILIVMLVSQTNEIQESIKLFGKYTPSYSSLTPSLLLTVIQSIEIWLAYFYNKYYTQKMLAEGWKPLKDDEYSNVLLKKYNYFEYTDNDLISDERTKEILDEVKKTEKKKALMFVVAAIIQILPYWL